MSGDLLQYIDRFGDMRVAVLGDLMLDVYFWGEANRISPEAPVPVVDVKRITRCLGGAGNVMSNIVTLGGCSLAFGMIGNDEGGRQLLAELDRFGIDRTGVQVDESRRTTEKQRVLAGHQQLLRLDHEDIGRASDVIREKIVEQVLTLIRERKIDGLIFEDYRKGLLSEAMLEVIVPEANRYGIRTALDPKPGSLLPVPGISVIKPNRSEAVRMCGLPNADSLPLDQVAEALLEKWQPEHLLISLAQDGMALFSRNGGKTVIPTRAREVFDVSGAGDTVVASFMLALAAGAAPVEAAEIGNYAAGVVVGKVGTSPVSAEELRNEIKFGKRI